jgi:hypothetical protein
MDTVGIHVPARQIREFSIFSVSSAVSRRAIATDDKSRFLDIFRKTTLPFLYTQIYCFTF